MRPQADRWSQMDDAQLREDELPVVAFDLGAGLPADQHELQRPSVGDVGREVEEVLSCPPRADGRAERLLLPADEGDRGDHRNQELQQAAAEHGHEPAEQREDEVAGFVEDQVGRCSNESIASGADRRPGELPRPDREPGEQRDARPPR